MTKLKRVSALCYLKEINPTAKIGLLDYDLTVTALAPDGRSYYIYRTFRPDADGYDGYQVMTKKLMDELFGAK